MRRKHLAAGGLALCAAVYWGYILSSGGVVRRAERKLDRPALGVPAASLASSGARDAGAQREPGTIAAGGVASVTAAARPGDPRARLDALEQLLEQLETPLSAGRFAGLDPLACAWSRRACAPDASAPQAEDDPEFAAWHRAHALGGTHVHGTLRIAILGGRVVREGDTLEGARVARIDPGSVELEWKGALRQLEVAPGAEFANAEPQGPAGEDAR